jgi:hypothetical protein
MAASTFQRVLVQGFVGPAVTDRHNAIINVRTRTCRTLGFVCHELGLVRVRVRVGVGSDLDRWF